jgi:hypothetical protein
MFKTNSVPVVHRVRHPGRFAGCYRSPDNEEIDLTLNSRRSQAPLNGLWLRVRYAVLNPGASRERYDIPVTLNWGVSNALAPKSATTQAILVSVAMYSANIA